MQSTDGISKLRREQLASNIASSFRDIEALARIHEVRQFIERPSRWQYVIHGESGPLRKAVAEVLIERGELGRALKVAMCGLGDTMLAGQKTVRVRPRRCGHPLCPRCSRFRGYRFVRRLEEWLGRCPHGSVYHVVLTQEVRPEESVSEAEERFDRRWSPFWRRLRRMGAVAGLVTTHVTASRVGGWHYHRHLVVELNGAAAEMQNRVELAMCFWADGKVQDGDEKVAPAFCRLLVDQGGPVEGLGEQQGDFWKEAGTAVGRVIQYAARDVCQGTDGWVRDEGGRDRLGELAAWVGAKKTRRLLGKWRTRPPEAVAVTAVDPPPATPAPEDLLDVGTVDDVLRRAHGGDEESGRVVQLLAALYRNKSQFTKRLDQIVHALCMVGAVPRAG